LYIDILDTTGTLFSMAKFACRLRGRAGELLMPLTYSIAYGLIGGIGTYHALHLWDWAFLA
jgi:xanthine/uracil/vitamin C permease (AzgA family)